MQISRAIALQSLAICAGLVLIAAVTIFSWSRYDRARDDAGRSAMSLQDFRLLEETTKSWLLNNDLIFGSNQNFLIMSTRRQGELAVDVAITLLGAPLGAVASDPLTSIIGLVASNQAELTKRQFLSAEPDETDAADPLDLWDERSMAVSGNLELARDLLQEAADLRADTLSGERNFLLLLCVLSYALFAVLVVALWHWLTKSLVKPLSDLTKLADAALRKEASLELNITGPAEVEQLTQSINASTRLREQRANERARELEEQKQVLENEVRKRILAEEHAQASARKAQEASNAKSQFLANMSHEIRTPLNGIIGSAEILMLDPSPEKTSWGLQNIQKSGEHLHALISQILDFSKIEAGQLEVDPHPFVLDDLLGKLRSIFAARALEKNIEFVFDIAPELPTHLVGDSLRIRQVLTNLLANAFTYTDEGSVLLRCDSVAGPQPDTFTLTWEVKDSGKGIPAGQQAHIFESFRQADSGTTRAFGGTGLGLTISKQLVELMGGSVALDSEPGMGSTFRCTMNVGAHAELSEFKGTRPGNALLFIRNPARQRSLERLLAYCGWSVACLAVNQIAGDLAAQRLVSGTTLFVDHVTEPGSAQLLALARERGLDRVILDDTPAAGSVTNGQSGECVVGSALIPGELFKALQTIRRQEPGNAGMKSDTCKLSGHVLLVEDNPVNQTVTQHMLELLGLTVSIAEDGVVALDMASREAHDIILMDWHMPRMDGLTATRSFREFEQAGHLRRTPIVMFTADAQKENEQICRQAGADDLLPKPVKLDALREALSEML